MRDPRHFLMMAVLALGCSSGPPQPAIAPTWSDSEPTVMPEPSLDESTGRVMIRTPRRSPVTIKGKSAHGARFRGYKVYDARGDLIVDRPRDGDEDDILTLGEGQYLVFVVLESPRSSSRDQTIQFVVARGATTYVDLTKSPTESEPRLTR